MARRGWRSEVLGVPKGLSGRISLFLRLSKSDVDIILIHKKLFNSLEVRVLKALKKRIVFDFDDAIMFTGARTGKRTGRFRRITEIADTTVAGNEYLANEARKHCRRVEILTTPVDIKKYTPGAPSGKEGVVIGWIGLKGNLFYLDALAPVFKKLALEFPKVSLSVICSDFPDFDGVNVLKRVWSIGKELELLRELDIGLMPLTDDIWSRGKGGYKILQYFSVGVPVVASPVGINRDIIKDGVNGFLASTEKEWESRLRTLIMDGALRKRMGIEGRKTVSERYDLENYLQRYATLLEGIAAQGKTD